MKIFTDTFLDYLPAKQLVTCINKIKLKYQLYGHIILFLRPYKISVTV